MLRLQCSHSFLKDKFVAVVEFIWTPTKDRFPRQPLPPPVSYIHPTGRVCVMRCKTSASRKWNWCYPVYNKLFHYKFWDFQGDEFSDCNLLRFVAFQVDTNITEEPYWEHFQGLRTVICPCSSCSSLLFAHIGFISFSPPDRGRRDLLPCIFPMYVTWLHHRPEDRGSMFLRNVGIHLQYYIT
jgi:hypothetical protein